MRAAEELRSALIFRALARGARVTRLGSPWPERFASAVGDEIRHARLCAAAGARLGAAPPRYDAAQVRARLAGLPVPSERVTALLLVEIAMGETISMSFFRAGRRAAIEPLTRATLQSILGDEVRHLRLGWSALAALWPTLSEQDRQRMQREATQGLAAFERQTAIPALRWLESHEAFDPAYAALGVLNPEARVEAFYAAVERLVVPRLTRLGLDGARAWQGRYRR
jgi:hypothetical protein